MFGTLPNLYQILIIHTMRKYSKLVAAAKTLSNNFQYICKSY